MIDPAVGLTFDETLEGYFALGAVDPGAGAKLGKAAKTTLTLTSHITVASVDRFLDDAKHGSRLDGGLGFAPLGADLRCEPGTFQLFVQGDDQRDKLMIYRVAFTDGATRYLLEGKKYIHDGDGAGALLHATTTLYTRIYRGDTTDAPIVAAGILEIGAIGAIRLVASIRTFRAEPDGTRGDTSWEDAEKAVAHFGGFFFGALWEAYRIHLTGPAGTAPPVNGVPRPLLARPASQLTATQATVVVVGSGYGGGIAACRLARAGQRVLVLERGKEWRAGNFPDTALETAPETQIDGPDGRRGPRTGLYDFRINATLDILVGCGLGGTSLINAGVALRPEPAVFRDPRWPAAFRADPAALDVGFARARQMLNPTPYPDQAPPLAKLDALRRSAEHLRWKFERAPINVAFKDGANAAGIMQRACNACGDCATGCNHGAKTTVDMTYLADAVHHQAELYTEVTVRWIEPRDGKYHVRWRWTDADDDEALGTIVADVVVLAAGTLGSTELLLRSRDHQLTSSPTLGHNISGNGDYLSFAYNGDKRVAAVGAGDRPVAARGPVGPTITGFIRPDPDQRPLGMRYLVEEGAIPGALADALPIAFIGAAAAIGVPTAPGLKERLAHAARAAESLVLGAYHGAVANTQTLFAIGHDSGEGVAALDGDRLRIAWDHINDQPIYKETQITTRRITEMDHGTAVKEPTWTGVFHHAALTAHPLGGCVMADDATRGVVNDRGQVFSGSTGAAVHRGLYVADGAIVPTSLGVNPLLTISALAERIMELMIQDAPWT
jgi:cholesterol oxidase